MVNVLVSASEDSDLDEMEAVVDVVKQIQTLMGSDQVLMNTARPIGSNRIGVQLFPAVLEETLARLHSMGNDAVNQSTNDQAKTELEDFVSKELKRFKHKAMAKLSPASLLRNLLKNTPICSFRDSQSSRSITQLK